MTHDLYATTFTIYFFRLLVLYNVTHQGVESLNLRGGANALNGAKYITFVTKIKYKNKFNKSH